MVLLPFQTPAGVACLSTGLDGLTGGPNWYLFQPSTLAARRRLALVQAALGAPASLTDPTGPAFCNLLSPIQAVTSTIMPAVWAQADRDR
jgi:hypothetical protein